MTPLRIIFMGTPDFAVPSLRALIEAGHEIVCVYAQPPRPAGRGQKERLQPVHEAAEAAGLPVRTPNSLKDKDAQEAFRALDADLAVVAAYGLILPGPVLAAPKLGCVNVHASILPRWRGAAPIQRAILAGDAETGATIMAMDEGLDTGAMLRSETVPIGSGTSAGELHDTLATLGARLLVETIPDLADGSIAPVPQPADGITYAHKIDKRETRLDFRKPAADLERTVRAFAPFPGAWCEIDGERIKVLQAEVGAGTGEPGTLLDDTLTVACQDGALRLLRVQRGGKAAMAAGDFLRGFAAPRGARLALPDAG